MTLLVDIGNSCIKSARWRAGALLELSTCNNTYALNLLANVDDTVKRVIACNVAGPEIGQNLVNWCTEKGATLEWITSTHPIAGLTHSYTQPQTLGDDRWLAMAGARRTYSGPLCVIDCGTATTVDIVDEKGLHRGGAILPGVATMCAALHQRTHHLPIASANVEAFATSTDSAITGGTTYALCGAIERLQLEARARLGPHMHCLITGGEAVLVAPLLHIKYTLDTKLVLTGLSVAAGLQ